MSCNRELAFFPVNNFANTPVIEFDAALLLNLRTFYSPAHLV